jgi:hypothetical protein
MDPILPEVRDPAVTAGLGMPISTTGLWAQGHREGMMWLMVDEREDPQSSAVVDRSEGFGERLLGSLLDRAHRMPPDMLPRLSSRRSRSSEDGTSRFSCRTTTR